MPVATDAVDGSGVYYVDDGGAESPVVFLGGFLDPIELARRAPLAQALQERWWSPRLASAVLGRTSAW